MRLIKKYLNPSEAITYLSNPLYNYNRNEFWGNTGWHWVKKDQVDPKYKKEKTTSVLGEDLNNNYDNILVDSNGVPVNANLVSEYYNKRIAEGQHWQEQELQKRQLLNKGYVSLPSITITDKILSPLDSDKLRIANPGKEATFDDTKEIERNNWQWETERKINHDILHKNNEMLDHLFVTLPVTSTLVPILGYGAATKLGPAAYNFLTTNPLGLSLLKATLLGEGVNETIKLGSNGYYNGWGDMMAKTYGGKEFWWSLTNPGYLGSEAVKLPVDLATKLTQEALKKVPDDALTNSLNTLVKEGYLPIIKENPYGAEIKLITPNIFKNREISLGINDKSGNIFVNTINSSDGWGKNLYDLAIRYAQRNGKRGIEVGTNLLSAPKTLRTYNHFDKKVIGNKGVWSNHNMTNGYYSLKMNSIKEFLEHAKKYPNETIELRHAPEYLLTKYNAPNKSLLNNLKAAMKDYSKNMFNIDLDLASYTTKEFVANNPGMILYPRYLYGKYIKYPGSELPIMYRRIKGDLISGDKNTVLTRIPTRFIWEEQDPLITNLTTDMVVDKHPRGDWTGSNLYAISGKNLLNHRIISTEPSDTFTAGKKLVVPNSKITFISGDEPALLEASEKGLKTIVDEDLIKTLNTAEEDATNSNAGKRFALTKLDYSNFEERLHNIVRSNFRSPTIQDYNLMNYVFRPWYPGNIAPMSMKLSYLNGLLEGNAPEWFINVYSNAGRRNNLNKLDNLLYNPSSPVEQNWRDLLGIKMY